MKNIVFIVVILFLSTVSAAQEESTVKTQTKFLVGGTFGFKYSENQTKGASSPYSRTYWTSISPLFGYSITENVMCGVAFEVLKEHTKTYSFGEGHYKLTNYLISPFARYYFNSPFFVHGQFNVGNSSSDQKSSLSDDSFKTRRSVTGFGFGIGYDIKLSDAIQLEPIVRYISNGYKATEDSYWESDFRKSDILFNLGFIYRF